MKKITNVTNVMMRKSRIAQRIRLTRYRNIRSLLPVLDAAAESYLPSTANTREAPVETGASRLLLATR
jgi:hypothetical protein